jgi:hypothetical protein
MRDIAIDVRFVERPPVEYGWMDPTTSATPEMVGHDDWLDCHGWVGIPGEDRVPKFILFAANGERVFIHAGRVGAVNRHGVAPSPVAQNQVRARWAGLVPAMFLPIGTSEVTAWAYDDQRREFVRLKGSKQVTRR